MAKTETKVLALLPALSLVFGCLEYGPLQGPERGSLLLTLHAIASLAVVSAWFWIDARRRAYKASIVLRVAMFILTVVALPYYLFRSRGLAGGLKGLALSVLVFAATMMAYRVGSLLA
jgi:hypothetical protein